MANFTRSKRRCIVGFNVYIPKGGKIQTHVRGITNPHLKDHVEELTIPEGVEYIDKGAFANLHCLRSITFPPSLHIIDNEAFAFSFNDKDAKVVLLDTIAYLGRFAFQNCTKLVSITLPKKHIYMVRAGTFIGCRGLTHVDIGDNCLMICARAFQNCGSLPSITLPNIKKIQENAFKDCHSLKEVNCWNLSGNTRGRKGFFSRCLSEIGDWAFCRCYNLRDFRFLMPLTRIGRGAFMECRWLKTVVLPNLCDVVRKNTFFKCVRLEVITLPKKLQKIEEGAFYGCESLKCIKLPHSLKEIAIDAFTNCYNMHSVIFHAPYPQAAFIVWVVSNSRRKNYKLTTVRNMRNILRMIVAMAAGIRRSVKDIDQVSAVFKKCHRLFDPEVRF